MSARTVLHVQGLDCPGEIPALRRALEGTAGVRDLDFDPSQGRMTVGYDPAAVTPEALAARVTQRSGMPAQVVDERPRGADAAAQAPSWRSRWGDWGIPLASGASLAIGAAAGYAVGAPWDGAFYAAAIAVGGAELVPKAWRGLRRGTLNIPLLVLVALAGAVALGDWSEAATLAFLFALAERLESLSLARARKSVRALLSQAPATAEVVEEDGTSRIVPASEVAVGRILRVRSGDSIPLDGAVASGRSLVNQQAITGESIPVERGPGDRVFAGTVNGDGALEIEVTARHDETLLAGIVERVRSAQASRAPVDRVVERFAAWYTPLVIAGAAAIMTIPPLFFGGAWGTWIYRGLASLLIACPCALVIATPVAVVCGLTAAARRGVLIKGGAALETFGRLRTLAFDKTGTLTEGRPEVVEVAPLGSADGADVLRIAASLGDKGSHVLGRAIAEHARGRSLEFPPAEDYRAQPGLGASATVNGTRYHIGSHRYIDQSGLCLPDYHGVLGEVESGAGTAVAVTDPEGPLGYIRLADLPRPEAAGAVAELRELGVEPVLLTGDNPPAAARAAEELGIEDYRASLLPEDKARLLAELDRDRGPAGMVGDGVNDAPALAAARVSVAPGRAATGAALEAADVVLMSGDLRRIPWLVRYSRRVTARIYENIAIALGIKLAVLALAVFGLAGLWAAIAADLGATLIVVANASRLARADA